jgi:PAS domain S-box-containing protein
VDDPPGAFRPRCGWSSLDVLTGPAITGEEQARGPWGAFLAFGVAYLSLCLSADWLTNQASEFSTFWPAAGLYVGILLLVERRAWPGFVAMAAAANVVASAVIGRQAALSASGAVADAVEAILAAVLIQRVVRGRPRMWRLRDLLALILLGAGLAAAIAALIGGAAVSVIRHVPFLPEARDWWIGDALGILVVAPLVLAWGRADFTEPSPVRKHLLEFAALMLASFAASWAVFNQAPSGVLGETYLVLPVFVWAALRFGPRGVTATGTVLAAAGAWATAWALQHAGTVALAPDSAPLQLYLALAISTALVLATEVAGLSRTERKLQLARFALDQGAEATLVADRNGHIVLASEAAGRLLGRTVPELLGAPIPALDPALAGKFEATAWGDLRALGTTRYETVLADGAGRRPPVEVHLAFLAFDGAEFLAWSGRDLSERRRVEEDQRLAAVGTLASGVAHEINNPLTYVTSNLAFVEETLAKVRGLHPDVEEAEEAAAEAALGARKVRDIVRDLRFVSRPPDGRRIEVEPVQEIRSAVTLAQAEIHRRSGLELHLDPCPHVLAGQGQIGQVMIHLLLNAAQSTPAGSPSTHTVRVSSRTDEAGWAAIEVADSGSGIPAAARARIFEPFFSTRPVGGGAGLGLSVCHGIVTGLGGSIDVVSEEGRGTTVRVRLPPAG